METANFLIADPNPHFLEKVEEVLRIEGYKMVSASDGLQAKALVEEENFTGVLAYWDLPKLDGIGLCKFIKKEYDATIPVVLMSRSSRRPIVLSRAIDVGVDNVLFRPVKEGELLFCLRSLIRLKQIQKRQKQKLEELSRNLGSTDRLREYHTSTLDFFKTFMTSEIKRAQRYNLPFSIMVTTIDQMDEIERKHGPHLLQRLFEGVARAVQRTIRDVDISVTLQNNTIIVFMPHTDRGGAQTISERVCTKIKRSVYRDDAIEIKPTISIGQTTYNKKADQNFSQIMQRGLTAMQKAIQAGGNRVVIQ